MLRMDGRTHLLSPISMRYVQSLIRTYDTSLIRVFSLLTICESRLFFLFFILFCFYFPIFLLLFLLL